ncbi:hypothetical protein BESB_030590 [Besnoitia besnoiti]|uniref:Checkpoint protein n=1 Tax=Besnoitia besnoiti TaxID=94643 RepID=A0A2A9LZJ6_BESBE|nr:hypothetical protein BESB_030590 [Besnoitia besnoiti]PFH31185.1 hypothetical protein BESB_030590 [Besnoitia besnoiti]
MQVDREEDDGRRSGSAPRPDDAQAAQDDEEAVQFDVHDVRLFAQLLSVIIPHSAGGASSASLADAAATGVETQSRGAWGSLPAGQEGDWSCVFAEWRRNEIRLRGVSRGRDVYSELRLASSFFRAFEYRGSDAAPGADRASRKRRRRRAAEGEAADDARGLRSEDGSAEAGEGGLAAETRPGYQVMIRVKELVNALMLFGENAHLRVRFAFDEGVVSLLLQERPLPGAGKSEDEEEAISEVAVKTFDVSRHERLPDLSAFPSAGTSSSADYIRINPQVFREILVDLLGSDEDAGASGGNGDVCLSVVPPPLAEFLPQETDQELRGAPVGACGGRHAAWSSGAASARERRAQDSPHIVMKLTSDQQSVAQEVALGLDPILFPRVELSRPHRHTYKLRSLLSVVPALKLATGLRLEWLQGGLLLLQLLIKPDLRTRLFLHFYLFPTVSAEGQ